MVTGGLNNVLRVWDMKIETGGTPQLKCLIEEGPDKKDDI
jgi:hypothetical protein